MSLAPNNAWLERKHAGGVVKKEQASISGKQTRLGIFFSEFAAQGVRSKRQLCLVWDWDVLGRKGLDTHARWEKHLAWLFPAVATVLEEEKESSIEMRRNLS